MIRRKEYKDLDEQTKEMIKDHMQCGGCADIGSFKSSICGNKRNYEEMVKNLPGLGYVKEQMLNYIFSNGLTSGSINGDKVLDEWLYSKNKQGATNYSVIREIIGNAAVFGECGMRRVGDKLYMVKNGSYAALTQITDGIKEVVAYYIRKDGEAIDTDLDMSELTTFDSVYEFMDSRGYILLDDTNFVNVRNDTSRIHGLSFLEGDRLRIDLLIKVYERLNYDIAYDGPGRIIIRPRNGFNGNEENESSTSYIVNNSGGAEKDRNNKAKEEATRIAREIKNSGSDSVILLSNAFDEHIEHLERVTKATEFFEWLSNEGVILSQDLGMSPSLLELGNVSGNVSMEKIIDNSMLNSIIPIRKKYAIQFSEMIVSIIKDNDVKKVYFDKYEMQQTKDSNTLREQVANTIQKLGLATGNMANADIDRSEVEKVINSLANQIQTSLYDENNDLVEI